MKSSYNILHLAQLYFALDKFVKIYLQFGYKMYLLQSGTFNSLDFNDKFVNYSSIRNKISYITVLMKYLTNNNEKWGFFIYFPSPDPSSSYILKAHLSFSSVDPLDVISVASINSSTKFFKWKSKILLTLKLMLPFPSLSKSLNIWLKRTEAFPSGRIIAYISCTFDFSNLPVGQSFWKPLQEDLDL